jgi:hypothetical protein
VFRELSPKETDEWEGPVNYITMVEAFKEGPHSTTPLHDPTEDLHEQQLTSAKTSVDGAE